MASATQRLGLVRWGGICGVVGPLATLGLVLAATTRDPAFRWDSNALSDLGVGPAAAIFNGALIFGGLLTIAFTLALRTYLPRTLATNMGTIILLVGGVSLALVGVFTEDSPTLHGLAALGYFILVPVGLLLISLQKIATWFRAFAIGTGVAALLAILVLPFSLASLGFAVPEVIEAIILAAWIVVIGGAMALHPTPQPAGVPASAG